MSSSASAQLRPLGLDAARRPGDAPGDQRRRGQRGSWRRIASCRRRSSGPGLDADWPRRATRAGVAVGLERVGLAPGAVQGEHPLRVQRARAAAARAPAARARRRTRDGGRRPGRGRSRARRAASRSSSSRRISAAANGSPATSSSGGPRHSASASRGCPAATSRSKRRDVEVLRAEPQLVAAPARDDRARRAGERLAQLRHVELHELRRRRGRRLAPQAVDQPLGGDGRAGVQREHRQQRARLARGDRDRAPVDAGLHGSQESDVHSGPPADTTAPARPRSTPADAVARPGRRDAASPATDRGS